MMDTKAQEQKPDWTTLRKYWKDGFQRAFNDGCDRVWDDYVTLLQSENLRLTEENERLKIELSNYAYQIDRAKRDRDKAELALEIHKKLNP